MRHVADRFTVVLDANVLYPFVVRDVLLTMAAAGLFRARWTQTIMDEWTRALIGNLSEKEAAIRRAEEIMRARFPEATVECHEPLIDMLELPDPDDRHVLAAAIKSGAHSIVRNNLKHFPNETLSAYQLKASSADDFILSTFELYQYDTIAALRKMREKYEKPHKSASDLIISMVSAGLTKTAAELNSHIELL